MTQATPHPIEGINWPPLQADDALPALMQQLEQTQWLSEAQLREGTAKQLALLITHAATHSAAFRARMDRAGLTVADLLGPDGLARLPVLSRREYQSCMGEMSCAYVPATHLPLTKTSSSGTSGEPVTVVRTAVCQLFWLALTLREHLWHARDFTKKLASIRASVHSSEPVTFPNWGAPVALLHETGAAHGMPIGRDIGEQLDWLVQVDPEYLLIYPSNLAALLDECERRNVRLPALRQIRTIAETLSCTLRERTKNVLNVTIADTYSSQELGVMAIQCPVSGLYHTMAENCIVEVLDAIGKPCAPGEVGRVIVTDLHNFATPMVRYDTGDYAEAGPPCHCGRHLPTLKRIVGRERNMVVVNGSRRWPLLNTDYYLDIAPISQYQLVQHEAETIEVRLVCSPRLSAEQEDRMRELIRESLGHPFQIRFTYFNDRIPLGASGKFEEFISLVTP